MLILRGISADVDLEADLDRLWALVAAVEDRDFALTVGPGGPTPRTRASQPIRDGRSEVDYTLDPAHYAVATHWDEVPYAELLDAVELVHARQAGSGLEEIQSGCRLRRPSWTVPARHATPFDTPNPVKDNS